MSEVKLVTTHISQDSLYQGERKARATNAGVTAAMATAATAGIGLANKASKSDAVQQAVSKIKLPKVKIPKQVTEFALAANQKVKGIISQVSEKLPKVNLPKVNLSNLPQPVKNLGEKAGNAVQTITNNIKKSAVAGKIEGFVKEAGENLPKAVKGAATGASNYVKEMPLAVKALAGASIAAVTLNHVARDNQIKGAFEGIRTMNEVNEKVAEKLHELGE